jgi:peptide/nickel transport system substrate-binding protein
MDAAQEVKARWEGTGNQVQAGTTGNLYQLEIQHRPEYARPTNGFTNLLVRQALYHAIDRASIDRVETGGLAPVADSYYMPQSFIHTQLAAEIPQFPYDPARAQQLLAQAGWTRGSDGVLVDQAGQRFETESRADRAGGAEKAQAVIADNWQAVGVRTDQVVLPVAGARDNEMLATGGGVYLARPSDFQFITGRLHTRNIAGPENRWAGANRGGYSNPAVDDLLDRLLVTFGEQQQVDLHRQLMREQMGNVALMPLWWNTEPALLTKGTKGPLLVRNTATWNIFDWDKE